VHNPTPPFFQNNNSQQIFMAKILSGAISIYFLQKKPLNN
jgi:hypothetical protein